MQDTCTFGTVLRTLRLLAGKRQKDVATSVDISENFLSQVENDRKRPSVELITRFASYYDVPPKILLWYVGERRDSEMTPECAKLVSDIDELLFSSDWSKILFGDHKEPTPPEPTRRRRVRQPNERRGKPSTTTLTGVG